MAIPRADAGAVLEIEARGLRQTERILQLDERDIRESLRNMITEIGDYAVFQLQAMAPDRTGRLKRGIRVTSRNRSVTRPQIRVGADVRSEDGFPYLGVTRFGRREVVVKTGSGMAARRVGGQHMGGRAIPARGYNWPHEHEVGMQKRPWRHIALRFEPGAPGSGFMYRFRVRPYKPKGDWVRRADEAIRAGSEEFLEDLTEEIEALFRSNRARGRSGGRRRVTIRVIK